MLHIKPHLWFDSQAKEAAKHRSRSTGLPRPFLSMKKIDLATLQRAYDGK